MHFARKVTAIELDANYCKKLRERGFEVVCRAVETVSATDLPAGDVYFCGRCGRRVRMRLGFASSCKSTAIVVVARGIYCARLALGSGYADAETAYAALQSDQCDANLL